MQFVPLFTIYCFVCANSRNWLSKKLRFSAYTFFCKAQIASFHVQDENRVYQEEDLPKSQGNEKIILWF